MKVISLVVVTYNSNRHIKQCLDSIFNQQGKDLEVIVVDNNSSDGTLDMLKGYSYGIKSILNTRNAGFGAAMNQGIRSATGEYILSLNSDVVITEGFISGLKRIISNLPLGVGMLCPKILKTDKKTIDSAGLVLTMTRRFYDRGQGDLDKGQFDEQRRIFGPCAAAAVYKREMLEEIKIGQEYFDEDFFLILDDFDIAWRAKRCGWEALFIPTLVCYHQGGISRERSPLGQYYSFRNRYFLLLKNEPWYNIWRLLLFALVYDIPRFGFLLFSNKYTLRALRELMVLTPKMLRKRKIAIALA